MPAQRISVTTAVLAFSPDLSRSKVGETLGRNAITTDQSKRERVVRCNASSFASEDTPDNLASREEIEHVSKKKIFAKSERLSVQDFRKIILRQLCHCIFLNRLIRTRTALYESSKNGVV